MNGSAPPGRPRLTDIAGANISGCSTWPIPATRSDVCTTCSMSNRTPLYVNVARALSG